MPAFAVGPVEEARPPRGEQFCGRRPADVRDGGPPGAWSACYASGGVSKPSAPFVTVRP